MPEGIVLPTHARFKNLTGQRFGRLIAVAYAGKTRRGQSLWTCRCDCGKEIVAMNGHLKTGHTTSCGCMRVVCVQTHGEAYTREYTIWYSMVQRCTSPKHKQWPDYGGRGIKVCDRWLNDVRAFIEDMGRREEGMTLERIDNDGNYEPGNCRWATRRDQARNRRSSRILTLDGVTRCLQEWAEVSGLKHATIARRLKHGMSLEKAISTPVHDFKTFTSEEKSAVVEMRASGMTMKQIAEKTGRSATQVARVFRTKKERTLVGGTGSGTDGSLVIRKPEAK